MQGDCYIGSFVGAAADVPVECGFVPEAVLIIDPTNAGIAAHKLTRVVTTGTDLKPVTTDSAVGLEIVGAGGVAASTGDVTIFAGDLTRAAGFTVANGAACNNAGVVVNFIALRGDR